MQGRLWARQSSPAASKENEKRPAEAGLTFRTNAGN
jgi:hypothetical protein